MDTIVQVVIVSFFIVLLGFCVYYTREVERLSRRLEDREQEVRDCMRRASRVSNIIRDLEGRNDSISPAAMAQKLSCALSGWRE